MNATRPTLVIISNGVTPYGIHSYRRIAREIPEISLAVFYTHDYSMGEWSLEMPDDFSVIRFGIGEHSTGQISPSRLLHEWAKAGRIIKQLKAENAQAVIMLGYNDLGRLRILSRCKRNNISLFIWADSNIRGDIASGLKARIKMAALTRILSQCAGVMPCGSLGSAYFQKYGVSPDRIFWVPNEPDYSLIEQITEEQIAEARERFGLADNRHRFIFSGRLVPVKRVDLLLKAFIQIADQRPDWDVVIAGDGPLAAELQSMIPPSLRERVIWTGFIGHQTKLFALYHSCDILVLPSSYEAWALVVNEAVAANLAVICSHAVGASPELVEEGVNGFTFPTDDLEKLTNLLLEASGSACVTQMKSASAPVLRAWQKKADPVAGVRTALQYCINVTQPE